MSAAPETMFQTRVVWRRRAGAIFAGACFTLLLLAAAILLWLLIAIARSGWEFISLKFLVSKPSVLDPLGGGIQSALVGTLWLMVLTTVISVPIGVGAAIYLEEYSRKNRFTEFIRLNIANLAGVPSIVYGILGLAVFARWMSLGRSVLSGSLTMALLILPVIIIACREAIAAVPTSIRQASYALGATRWQTIRHHVLPAAIPGIMTGVILSMARAIGETAPLILIGAVGYVRNVPGGSLVDDYPHSLSGFWDWFTTALHDSYTVLPIQIFDWARRPLPEFHSAAAAGIIVLLGVLLSMNAVAVGIRAWHQKSRI